MSYNSIKDLIIPSTITLVESVQPSELSKIYKSSIDENTAINTYLLEKIRGKICNKCNNKGYVTNDIDIINRSIGKINAAHFTGDIHYTIKVKINICIPLVGSKIKTKVVGKNEAGILCVTHPFKIMISPLDDRTSQLNIGDEIIIEVQRYKVDINGENIKILANFVG